jgi:hypothetical protein
MHHYSLTMLLALLAGCARTPLAGLSPLSVTRFWTTVTLALVEDFGDSSDVVCLSMHIDQRVSPPSPELVAALRQRGLDVRPLDDCMAHRDTTRYGRGKGRYRFARLGASIQRVKTGLGVVSVYGPVYTPSYPDSCEGRGWYVLAERNATWTAVERTPITLCL